MLSALPHATLSGNNANPNSPDSTAVATANVHHIGSRPQSPATGMTSSVKAEPGADSNSDKATHRSHMSEQRQQNNHQGLFVGEEEEEEEEEEEDADSMSGTEDDRRMDYFEDSPAQPHYANAHPGSSHRSSPHGNNNPFALTPSSSSSSISVQPQQHQQLLKLKTEHGLLTAPSPVSTPDIIMTSDDTEYFSRDPSRRALSESNLGTPESRPGDSPQTSSHHEKDHLLGEGSANSHQTPSSASPSPNPNSTPLGTPVVGDSGSGGSNAAGAAATPVPIGLTAPTTRRPSLRTMTATLPRSALQEETIALFKQYRNLIPCAKCFCRNTIQRDGMSDGNLRFKCRPPVSMSLICNKSYSESKIRNMIAGVVYGHSLPDVATPTSASSPGENILALAPPPMPAKPSRRASHKNDSSPRLVSDLSSERHARHYDELENDRSENGMHHHHHHHHQGKEHASLQRHSGDSDGHGDETRLPHPLDARRGSHVVQQSPMHSHHQVGRRASIQPARRASLIGEDAGIMDYDDAMMNSQGGHAGQLQIPGTPPLDSDDPRLYRSRSTFMHSARSVTPTGHPSSGSSRPSQKLHHSHSHPNIGQARHQHFLEQQEREHRGSIANIGAANQQYHPQPSSSQQQPAQRQIPRQMSRRESTQHLGGHMERRASYAALQATSPGGPGLNGSSKYGSSSGHMGDALSPALSSSPRSSPGRETFPPHMNSGPTSEHGHTGTSLMRSSSSTSRYDEGASLSNYLQRRMSQPHPSHAYVGPHHPSDLPPPPVSSGLSHAYDRRPSELDEYPRSHREKYEKLNASTLLSPSSRSQQRMKSYHGHPHQGHHPLQGDASPGGMEGRSGHLHPVDQVVSDDGGAKQAMTPPMRSHHGAPTSPWMHSTASSGHGAADQSSKYAQAGHMNGGSRHGSFRQQPSSAGSGYYQQPRHEDKDRYDTDNDGRDMSPDYTDMDVDGRPIARMRQGGMKRKSLGQSLSRSSSNQNLYSSANNNSSSGGHSLSSRNNSLNEHAHQNTPQTKNMVKLTCFPSTGKSGPNGNTVVGQHSSRTLDTTEAVAMQLQQNSRIVIEISQPRAQQSYASTTTTAGSARASPKTLHRAASQPNLLSRSSNSVLGFRRSASPESGRLGTTMKRMRADEENPQRPNGAHESAAEAEATAAAAAVVAAAAAAGAVGGGATPNESSAQTLNGIQVIGLDYVHGDGRGSTKGSSGVGLGLGICESPSSATTPVPLDSCHGVTAMTPSIEALDIAHASSYAPMEDQKSMGIDYSMFTRVETAGWRILIPPNVVASFRSEDFGLMLKPKGVQLETGEEEEAVIQESGTEHRHEEEEEEDDLNVEGVSRILLQDDHGKEGPELDRIQKRPFRRDAEEEAAAEAEAQERRARYSLERTRSMDDCAMDSAPTATLKHPLGKAESEEGEEEYERKSVDETEAEEREAREDVEMTKEQDELLEDDDHEQ